jgi:hypothetical protein
MSEIKCYTCNKPAESRCTKCIKTYYCSKICQKNDWQNHKLICKNIQKEVNEIQELSYTLNKMDQIKSCSQCNISFNKDSEIITCANNGYCSINCREIHQTINKKNHDRNKFSTLLSFQCTKREYLTISKIQDKEIIDKFDEIIVGIKRNEQHFDMTLIFPFLAEMKKYYEDNPALKIENTKIYKKLMKEYDEGKRTIDSDDYFN